MAVADYILLSSSPHRPSTLTKSRSTPQEVAPPSSPDLPSPSQLLMPGHMRHAISGAAHPIAGRSFAHPENQTSSNTCNMRFMLKAKELLAGLESKPLDSVKKTQNACRISDGQCTSRGKSRNTSNKIVVKNVERGEQDSLRANQSKHFAKVAQTKIRKTNITKPGAGTSGVKRCKGEATEAKVDEGDAGRDAGGDNRKEKGSLIANDAQGLGLSEALKRRRDWTPSKEPLVRSNHFNDTGTTCTEGPCLELQSGSFGKLVEDFGYLDAGNMTVIDTKAARKPSGESGTKRRRLNLVSGVHSAKPRKAPVKKDKSPKKKAQTITDKATAPFVPDDQRAASIRRYFGATPSDTDVRLPQPLTGRQEDDSAQLTVDVPPRKTTKASTVKTKVAKKTCPALTLVPPEAAIKTVNEQDVLFGTCSQLAREESPTFTRHVQQAVEDSAMIESSASVSRENESQVSHQSTTSLSTSRLSSASRRMWSEAARNSAGSLLDVDVVDLVKTPQPSRTVVNPRAENVALAPPAHTHDGDFTVVEDAVRADAVASPITEPQQDENPWPRLVAEAFLRDRPRSKSPIKKQRRHKDTKMSAAEPARPAMPNYNGFTEADLKKELAAFGFKPMRRRRDIIPLLQTCWETKQRIVLQSLPPNAPVTPIAQQDSVQEASEPCDITKTDSPKKKRGRPATKKVAGVDSDSHQLESVASPKKARGRPRKNTVTKNAKSDPQKECPSQKISDAEDESSPPPPRKPSSTKRKGLSTSTTSLLAMTGVSDSTGLFVSVAKAVTSFPPTHDVKNLTWHEKMLLYDPIVLEDLADWLNMEGLSRVGCEDKITPGLTKQWCESQSICCVWRENLRGGTRARY
ncbi:MAG: hypothetical protein Q9185_006403 [Variospora sp. 1 TL-2023]